MVQMSNELAEKGLCESLIPYGHDQDDALLRAFFSRLEISVTTLRRMNPDGFIVLFIDAADNAEMAAELFSDTCFAAQMLRETLPDGVKLVELCRTERLVKLRPPHRVQTEPLRSFTMDETRSHLEGGVNNVSDADCKEFHRLTNGNPRVQANAISAESSSIAKLLKSLGPSPISVDEQIEKQLEASVYHLRDEMPLEANQQQIDAICIGLANLPPFVPIKVLATAAQLEESAVRSFVSDLGRPLWITDEAVQFRDEPTETWFTRKFHAQTEQFGRYVQNLKPLAASIPYVSEAIPLLLLQGNQYAELIDLALSGDLLPEDNPIDARNVMVNRLQFAFKAALRANRYADAVKLAMRAGEEISGDDRQYGLLKSNIDILAKIQSSQKIQDIVYRQSISGAWQGSSNIYSASLLSTVPEFHGEARSFARSAENWLHVYFEDRENNLTHTGTTNSQMKILLS